MNPRDLDIARRLVRSRPPPKPVEGNLRWWVRSRLARPWPLADGYISANLVLRERALEESRAAVERIRMALESGLFLDDLPELDEIRGSVHVTASPTSVAKTLDAGCPGCRELVVRLEPG